jgi:hypothetical protein
MFIAIDTRLQAGCPCSAGEMADRLSKFIKMVEDETERSASIAATDYFVAARSNSNDTGPRKKRHEILTHVLNDTVDDYTGAPAE